MEAFIKSGAMDELGYTRKTLLGQVESLTDAAKSVREAKEAAAKSLFGDEELAQVHLNLENLGEFSQKEILEFEKESLGFYASGHPLDAYKESFKGINYTPSNQIQNMAENSKILIVGQIEDVLVKFSKTGRRYGILKIQDLYGSVELTIFEQILAKVDRLDKEIPIAIRCLVQEQNETKKLKAEKILTLEEAKKEEVVASVEKTDINTPLMVLLDSSAGGQCLRKLREFALIHSGKRELRILFRTQTQELEMISNLRVHSEIKNALSELQWCE